MIDIGKIIVIIGGIIIFSGGGVALYPAAELERELGETDDLKITFNEFEKDLTLVPGEHSFDKQAWYLKDVRIFLNVNPSNVPVFVMIQTEDEKMHYSSEAKGEFRDSVTVVPGKAYFVTVTNIGTESVYFENYEFNNPEFQF